MNEEEKKMLEHRLTALEMGVAHLKQNSDDRLEAIMRRFDRLDRRAAWWVNGFFAVALAVGGIYLEAYLNKEDTGYTKPSVATERV